MKIKTTEAGNTYVETHRLDTGLVSPVVYILKKHGKPVRGFYRHKDGERALLATERHHCLDSYHPDNVPTGIALS